MQPLWFDGVILLILIVATVRGAVKGLVWQLAWIAAIVLSFAFSQFASVTVADAIPVEPPLNRWLAMLGLYVVAAFVSFALAIRLRDWIEKMKFKDFDRHLGMIFGFLKGAALSLVVIFFSVTLSETIRETALHSRSGYAAAVVMQQLHPVMPAELHDVLHPYIHDLDEVNGVDVHAHDGGQGSERDRDSGSGWFGSTIDHFLGQQRRGEELREERRKLMFRIAAVYARPADEQQAIVEEMEQRLGGVGEGVVMGLLRDWDADLHPGTPDPEPATTAATKFSARLQFHLEHGTERTTANPGSPPR